MFLFRKADKLLTIFEKQISIDVPTGRGTHKIARWCCIMPVSMYLGSLQYHHWFAYHSTGIDICHNGCVGCLLCCHSLEYPFTGYANHFLYFWDISNATFIHIPYSVWFCPQLTVYHPLSEVFKEFLFGSWVCRNHTGNQQILTVFDSQFTVASKEELQLLSSIYFLHWTKSFITLIFCHIIG